MTPFQWITVSLLGVLALREVIPYFTSRRSSYIRLLRLVVWVLAAVAIATPNVVQRIATLVGIGRGADIILYGFVLCFLFTSFYFYSRTVRLQRQITLLVRHLAIQEAQQGGNSSQGSNPPTSLE